MTQALEHLLKGRVGASGRVSVMQDNLSIGWKNREGVNGHSQTLRKRVLQPTTTWLRE